MSVKALRNQLLAAIAMVLVAAIALGSSTFAWFVNNTQVTATNVKVQAVTSYSLMIKGSDTGDEYGTTKALNDSVILRPVSSVGKLATAEKELSSTPSVVGNGDDTTVAVGDIEFFKSNAWNAAGEVKTFIQVSNDSFVDFAGTDGGRTATAGTNDGDENYYYSDTIYLKAGQASKIYLDNTLTGYKSGDNLVKFNDDTNVTGATLHLLQTMRIALVVTQGATPTRTVFFYTLNDTSSGTGFAYNTTKQLATTGDVDGLKNATSGEDAVSAIVASNLVSGSVTNIYTQAADGIADGFATTNSNSKEIATVAANEEIQVDIYMWMEGCDYDTTAANSAQFQTTIENIQLGFCVGATA